MIHDLARTWARLAADASVRAAVLIGAGRAFSAGVDLTGGGHTPPPSLRADPHVASSLCRITDSAPPLPAAQSVFQGDVEDTTLDPVAQMAACAFPIIGAINGPAITAGVCVWGG